MMKQGFTVYGRHAAIHIHLDRLRTNQTTLGLDAAFRSDQSGQIAYNWDDKLYLQFTHRELPEVACVFLGLLDSCAFTGRGGSGKGFSFERQESHLFMRVWQGDGRQYLVQAQAEDLFHLSALAIKACSDLYDIDGSGVIIALRSCARMKAATRLEV